jgi:hypothetical protein
MLRVDSPLSAAHLGRRTFFCQSADNFVHDFLVFVFRRLSKFAVTVLRRFR